MIGRLQFVHRALAVIPHPQKVASGGEDAYLSLPNVIGVADGVGSWAQRGVDAGAYSAALMKHCYEAAYEASLEDEDLAPRELLRMAWSQCQETTVNHGMHLCHSP